MKNCTYEGTEYEKFSGELLYIGVNPTLSTENVGIIVDYQTAANLIEKGWPVTYRPPGSIIWKRRIDEHTFYVSIRIPNGYPGSRLTQLKRDLKRGENPEVSVEVNSDLWTNRWTGKQYVRPYLEQIQRSESDLSREIRDLDISLELDRGFSPYLTVNFETSTKLSSAGLYRQTARQLSQREFNERNNPRKTSWKEGDTVWFNGNAYTVGRIQKVRNEFVIHLERKYERSVILRVPRG